MGRVIKFRAWSIKYKEFISVGFSVLGETTCFNLIELWYIENKCVNKGLLDLMFNDVVIEQFTGLKDKNGKDIYEGDVMCWEKYLNTKHQSNWVVKFDAEKGYKTWHSHPVDDAIVIGNIHSNPELS